MCPHFTCFFLSFHFITFTLFSHANYGGRDLPSQQKVTVQAQKQILQTKKETLQLKRKPCCKKKDVANKRNATTKKKRCCKIRRDVANKKNTAERPSGLSGKCFYPCTAVRRRNKNRHLREENGVL